MSKKHEYYTKQEMRHMFVSQICDNIDYWLNEARAEDARTKLEGLAFSILVMLDGEAADIPAFEVIPMSTAEDRKYLTKSGSKCYPPNTDIAGGLHPMLHEVRKSRRSNHG